MEQVITGLLTPSLGAFAAFAVFAEDLIVFDFERLQEISVSSQASNAFCGRPSGPSFIAGISDSLVFVLMSLGLGLTEAVGVTLSNDRVVVTKACDLTAKG